MLVVWQGWSSGLNMLLKSHHLGSIMQSHQQSHVHVDLASEPRRTVCASSASAMVSSLASIERVSPIAS